MSSVTESFFADCREALRAAPGAGGPAKIKALLEKALATPEFVAETCGPQVTPGLYPIYTDPDLGFQVLVHVNEKPRLSPPHDHGSSWAVYGQALGHTDMVEYRRTDDGGDDGRAQLGVVRRYRLLPGQVGTYTDGAIHSIDYPGGSRFVRVTGTNLDLIERDAYELATGKIKRMLPQQAT